MDLDLYRHKNHIVGVYIDEVLEVTHMRDWDVVTMQRIEDETFNCFVIMRSKPIEGKETTWKAVVVDSCGNQFDANDIAKPEGKSHKEIMDALMEFFNGEEK